MPNLDRRDIGGILNPALATASLLVVWYSLSQQIEERAKTARFHAIQSFEQLLFELIRQHRYNFEAIEIPTRGYQHTKGGECFVKFIGYISSHVCPN